MFRIEYHAAFSAAHALLLRGEREPLHGHDWHLTVTLEGPALDEDGLLVDFHALAHAVDGLIGPWKNRNLNDVSPFDRGLNPSAENVAAHIGERLSNLLQTLTAKHPKSGDDRPIRLASVRVTEAVGCAATYIPSE